MIRNIKKDMIQEQYKKIHELLFCFSKLLVSLSVLYHTP
jgi:hypothetical protein